MLPAALIGFEVDSFAKLFRRLDGSGVGSRIRIADGEALLVVRGLGEHTSQLDLPRMGGLTVCLALAAYSFLLDHRHSGPIHLHIENRNRLAEDNGKIQLDRFLDLLALTLSDILSNRFCGALHRLGSHLQSGQNFHLFAAMIEGSILAHQSVHTAHPGRELHVLDIQFHVGRKLSLMTMRAQIVGTRQFHLAQGGEKPS